MDYSLSDELLAISSIYGDEVLTPEPSSEPLSCILHVPHSRGVELRLVFGILYPKSQSPDVVAVVHSGDESVPQGHGKRIMQVVRDKIVETFVPDQPVLFELIEALMDMEDDLGIDQGLIKADAGLPQKSGGVYEQQKHSDNGSSAAESGDQRPPSSIGTVRWVASDVVVEKKSTFVAHACSVSNAAEAKRNTDVLLSSDKKFEKATHNMSAFKGRYRTDLAAGVEREIIFQDCDDDGEEAAGGRLLHLLELTKAENVLVVVSRWYGGVKLGPDRFRIINQVAREALVRGGWVEESSSLHKQAKKGRQ